MARGGFTEIFRVAAQQTVEATRAELAKVAKREHARIMATDPKPSRFTRVVDGVSGAREEAVKAGGRIEYTYARLDDVVQAAMELLFDLSPVLSGAYREGHQLFVDGAPAANLQGWDGTGEVVITNMLPYARKIEAGKMKMRVPDTERVYFQAEILLRHRFSNRARIKFTYRSFIGAGAVPMSGSQAGRGARAEIARAKAANRFPALEIEALR